MDFTNSRSNCAKSDLLLSNKTKKCCQRGATCFINFFQNTINLSKEQHVFLSLANLHVLSQQFKDKVCNKPAFYENCEHPHLVILSITKGVS